MRNLWLTEESTKTYPPKKGFPITFHKGLSVQGGKGASQSMDKRGISEVQFWTIYTVVMVVLFFVPEIPGLQWIDRTFEPWVPGLRPSLVWILLGAFSYRYLFLRQGK